MKKLTKFVRAYEEGRAARFGGHSLSRCPYRGRQKSEWLRGYEDAESDYKAQRSLFDESQS